MTEVDLFSALHGLAGAVNNNGKTKDTDAIIKESLMMDNFDEAVRLVNKEKFTISPGCASCPNPCGNTSGFDVKNWEKDSTEVTALKGEIIKMLKQVCQMEDELPTLAYKTIAYLGYEMKEKSYEELLEELKKWLDR